ncbi:MAG: hypothetical protein NZ908_01355 [Candidatus Micrarchaeota archaeon]|nr:hypothetical protein [Candidatus Micrarchaeota archaeon]MCX8154356.1 hypothetical protein [Candidatus Micrarchaeota archaeon]
MQGAVSLEMIILIVLILAAVMIVGSMLLNTTQNATEKIDEKTSRVISKIERACIDDSDCDTGRCERGVCR